jgi:hypothetical protein
MAPKFSVACLQKPIADPSEPEDSSPYPHSLVLYDPLNIILPSIPRFSERSPYFGFSYKDFLSVAQFSEIGCYFLLCAQRHVMCLSLNVRPEVSLDLSLTKIYWLLGRSSRLSLPNKLLLYKSILKPISTYGIHSIHIQHRDPRTLSIKGPAHNRRCIRRDLQMTSVKEEICHSSNQYCTRLTTHPQVCKSSSLKPQQALYLLVTEERCWAFLYKWIYTLHTICWMC